MFPAIKFNRIDLQVIRKFQYAVKENLKYFFYVKPSSKGQIMYLYEYGVKVLWENYH